MAKKCKVHRPEDRYGLRQETLLSQLYGGVYRTYSRLWRKLPLFKGKVRIAKKIRRFLHLENHHFVECVNLCRPVPYKAKLDHHSWLEFVAYFAGGYEAETVEFLAKCYDKRGYFLDVGANIGLISIPFSIITNPAKTKAMYPVYCIEAVRSNQERLYENIMLNGLSERIVPINRGVAESEKTVEIQVEGNLKEGRGTGTANILPNGSGYACERITLDVTTLDKLVESGLLNRECSLIKIDLDGYDLKALQGAEYLISSSRPVVYGEFSAHCLRWHGQKHEDVESYMRKFDYGVYYRIGKTWRFSTRGSQDHDLLIIPMERRLEFSWCCETAS